MLTYFKNTYINNYRMNKRTVVHTTNYQSFYLSNQQFVVFTPNYQSTK